MASPSECRFTESHEWVRIDGDVVTLGITQYAANELTDVTYVEMRDVGTTLGPGDTVGVVESVKTTSDVVTPVPGEIVETNDAPADDPSLINGDPFGSGWLVKIRTDDASALDGLMDASAYDAAYPIE